MATEWEIKWRTSPRQLQALDEAAQSGTWARERTVREMESRYFDSESGALSEKKQTLRLRKENGIGVVTFKTAGDGRARGEWSYEAESVEDAGRRLGALGAPVGSLPGLTEICSARFRRIAWTVRSDEFEGELALDCGTLSGGGRTEPLCEAELEYRRGSHAALEAFAAELAGKYALTEEPKSKFVRALALAKNKK